MSTEHLRRLFGLSPLTINQLIQNLSEFVRQTGSSVDLILVGGLALQAYGISDRVTLDVDGELIGELESLVKFFQMRQIPADLGENMSGWSVVSMPSGYRERTSVFYQEPGLRLRLLDHHDFIIAKLRRGTEQDLDDAELIAQRFGVSPLAIQAAAGSAIEVSPKDTSLFLFQKTVELFCKRIGAET